MGVWPRLRLRRDVAATFAIVTLVSVAVLGFLSWQLIQQDRLLDVPRRRGLVEAAADRTQAALVGELQRLDQIVAGRTEAPDAARISRVSVSAAGTVFASSPRLPFVPTRASLPEAAPARFAAATALAVRPVPDPEGARRSLEALADSPDPAIRAGALARLAPLVEKRGDTAAALRAYDALASIDEAAVGGLPASLVASAGRADVLSRAARRDALAVAAEALANDLARGRWALTTSEYEFYTAQAAEWLGGHAPPSNADAESRADAASWVWNQRNELPTRGRRLHVGDRGAALVAWQSSGDHIDAVIGGPEFLADVLRAAVPPGFAASLRDLEGRPAAGAESPQGEVATRLASPDGLPWTLQLTTAESSPVPSANTRARVLWLVGLTTVVVAAGWYFIWRALGRELQVAHLQQEFVASVSHEFRSPLTSLAHLGDLLAKNRLPTDEHRLKAYDAIVSDTARLRDLVEHLLDFGRFEAGAVTLRREHVDLGQFVTDIVADARRRVGVDGYTIDFTAPADPVIADVDRVALGRAIWNLIDNAVKYSPDCRTIWVDVAQDGAWATVAVRDEGIGIPLAERDQIFHRFVRGAESQSRRIKGTGIGLALVRQIVEAHGGEVRLTSDEGRGSRFVVALHAAGDA